MSSKYTIVDNGDLACIINHNIIQKILQGREGNRENVKLF